MEAFARTHLNSDPPIAEIEALLPVFEAVERTLAATEPGAPHPLQAEYSYKHLIEAAGIAAKCDKLKPNTPTVGILRRILLKASVDPEPHLDPGQEEDDEGSLHSNAPRAAAAAGLLNLCMLPEISSPDLLEAISKLSRDPSQEVRYRLAMHINALCNSAPVIAWEMVENILSNETSRGVISGAFYSLVNVGRSDLPRLAQALKRLYERMPSSKEWEGLREQCAGLFVDLALYHNLPVAHELLNSIVEDAMVQGRPCINVLGRLRPLLTIGSLHPVDPEDERRRAQAFELSIKMIRSAYPAYVAFELEVRKKGAEATKEDIDKLRSLHYLVDAIGSEVYFGSGVSATGRHKVGDVLSTEVMERFYREAGPLLDELAKIGVPQVTHHLLETLEYFIPQDPRGVLLRIATAVKAGTERNYQAESQGMDLLVDITRRFVADHRDVLAEFEECRLALLQIVDVFVEAGWPSAYPLIYDLDDIYR